MFKKHYFYSKYFYSVRNETIKHNSQNNSDSTQTLLFLCNKFSYISNLLSFDGHWIQPYKNADNFTLLIPSGFHINTFTIKKLFLRQSLSIINR